MKLSDRSSGVLLPVFSLPGNPFCGDLGLGARNFVDFLAEAGQSWWQMLPLNPIDSYNSPYSSISSFAGEPLFIDLDDLVEEKLLTPDEMDWTPEGPMTHVAYAAARDFREPRLRKAFERYRNGTGGKTFRQYHDQFLENNAFWIHNHSLFCALAEHFGTQLWSEWPNAALRHRDKEILQAATEKFADEIAYHTFCQLVFDVQWNRLREYCREKNVGLLGDVPIYVAAASADTWGHPELFQLDENGHLLRVAGVPGDSFNPDGQRWDSPLYQWDAHKAENYTWWLNRMRITLHRFDAVRLDHFIGFHNYYSLPAQPDPNDIGQWLPGPGEDFFDAIFEVFPNARLIAEDLGVMHEGVLRLRDKYSLPGINVLQFHFDWRNDGDPTHSWNENSIVCTGTHDTNTVMGWLHDVQHAQSNGVSHFNKHFMLHLFLQYVPEGHNHDFDCEIAWKHLSGELLVPYDENMPTCQQIQQALLRMVLRSPGNVAILPMQDVLGLDGSARINFPGTATGNWGWRLGPMSLTEEQARLLREWTEESNRITKR